MKELNRGSTDTPVVLLYDPAKNPSIAATSLGSVNGGRTRAKDAAAKKAGLDKPAAILAKYPLPSPEVFVRDVAAIIPEAVYGTYVCMHTNSIHVYRPRRMAFENRPLRLTPE